MKALLSVAVALCVTTTAHAVSNRVFENLKNLEKIGFVFTADEKPTQETIDFRVRIPKEFKIEIDEDKTVNKPFSGVALVHLDRRVEHGPMLIEAPGTYIRLESRKLDDGCHETKVSIPMEKAELSYLAISYAYPNNADWPMLIHVPLLSITKQLQARIDAAPAGASAAQSSPKKEEQEKAPQTDQPK